MVSYGLSFILVVLVVQKCSLYVQGQITKSSLTFVIDDTFSMWDEINQVKEEVNIIFEKVLSSKASQIENFVLVTFNDPGAQLRTITKDKIEFKNALASITVHSLPTNLDCAEEAMTGIELGLIKSLPLSYIYVFTDATAKDYIKFKQIKSISQKKQSQVVFLLTGDCDEARGPEYEAYQKVAQATGGQIFHMMKDDVKDILKYIEESITGRGVPFINKKYPPGTHKVKFNVDARTGDVLISLTGLGSRIGEVTGPGGIKPPAEPIVSGKAKMAVKRLSNLKPGDYEVEIEGKGEVHIIMIAKSDINFQLGFSIDSPTSIKETVTRPPPEGNTFLGARLLGEGVALTSVRITDLDNNVIEELPLTVVDKKEQFYITPSFHPPSTMFLVTVIGKDLKTGTPVIRTGPTPIARQDPTAEPAVNTAPEVTIQGAPKIIAEHDATLTLKCNVHCYPAPDIIWSEKDTGIIMPAKVQTRDVPYDYFSSLEIIKTNKNVTYECKASNSIGITSKYVDVERRPYFDVIEAPKDISVEYTKEGSIVCKIDAFPPATVTWYKDGAVFVGNTNVVVSGDKSTLTIKSMQPELKGKYSCEARSDIDRKVFIVDVDIFGVEKPVIDKSHGEQRVPEKTNGELSCRILKGIPKPTISWSFKPVGTTSFSVMTETTETVQLKEVRQGQTGTYQCTAQNALGSDSFTMELIVEYPPTIKVHEKAKEIKNGEKVRIPCDVTGEPTPTVQWFFKGILLASSSKTVISSDHSIEFIATPSDIGDYTCEAKNKLDTAKITVSLDVLDPPTIKVHEKAKEIKNGEKVRIPCDVTGEPTPTVQWFFKGILLVSSSKIVISSDHSIEFIATPSDIGDYTCEAKNKLDTAKITVSLDVLEAPVVDKSPKEKRVREKTNDALSCRILRGNPKPTISWSFKPVGTTSFSVMTETTETVQLKEVRQDQTGTYQCTAQNALGSDSFTMELIVEYPPTIKVHEKAKEIKNGEKVRIPCDVTGEPTPTVQWFFKGILLASSSKIVISSDHSIEFIATPSDIGDYTCEAKNKLDTAKITVSLDVLDPPTIKVHEKAKEIKNGEKVRIPCDVTGEPTPTVQWFFKGILLVSSSKIVISSDHSIEFIATPSDIGDYTCEAKNKLDTAKITVSLDVLEAPVVDKSPKEKRVREKTNDALSCRILRGNPKPTISWSFKPVGTTSFSVMTETTETVQLKEVRQDQTGTYQCTAQNALGSDSFTMELIVEYPPTIKVHEKAKEIKNGEKVRIPCDVTGEPTPTVQWFFKGILLASSSKIVISSDHSIEFIATPSDIGDYTCEAKNKLDTAKITVSLDVLDPPTIKVHEKAKEIKNGEKVRIPCDVTGEPNPTVQWFFKGILLARSSKIVISSDHSIEFIATPSDIGDYTCEAKNKLDTAKITVSLDVLEAPVVDKSPKEKRVIEKTNDALSCRILRGNPKPTISWSFKPVGTTSFSVMTETTETVKLKEVRQDQTGTYQCTAQNALGSDSFTMELIVEYPPTIKVHEKAKEIKNGEKVRIPCDVTGEPTPTVQWFFKGILLASSSKIVISSDHSIEFIATPSDIGDYMCEAKNKLDTAKITVSLDVLEAPVVDKSPKEKRVREKTNDALSCRILRGNPKPTISWSFKPVGTTSFSVMTETTETVQLKEVRQDQTGTYQCTAQNALGSDSFTMELIVEYPPTIKVHEKAKEIKNVEKVRIPCDVTGEPTPTVQWFFKGILLASSSKIVISSDHSIEFIATPSDIGDYTCEAKNKLDTAKITVSLDVLEAPVVDKSPKEKRVIEKTNDALSCRILRGNPKPTISWSFKPVGTTSFSVMTETTETVQLKEVRQDQSGTYQCTAQNALGSDSFTMELIVEYPPTIKVHEKAKEIKNGEKVRIPCDVTGEPTPTVQWFFKGILLASSSKIVISSDHSIEFIATPSDIGDYTCEAKNKLDTAKITVSLDVLEAPVVDKSPKEKRVIERTKGALSCRILRGNPKPTISWSFKPVGTTSFSVMPETSETVQLKEVRQDQTGTYQCTAQNALGSDSFTMELIVEYPPTIKVHEKAKEIKNGEKVRIPCDVTGEPTPTVQWFFKGILLASSSKTVISSDHSIEFIATPSDIGDYTCEAKNKLDTAKITVSLDVLEAPVVDKSPKEKRVIEKTNDALSCRILRGNPKPTISWSFKPVGTTSLSVMTETTETVQLKEVRQDQTGTYQCTAHNALGSDSFTMELIVEYPPTIKVHEKAKEIKNGEKVRIPCDVTGEPTPTVQWFFKGILLASSSKIVISSDHSIEFIATPSDIGDYTCEAKNKLDTAKITVSLDVLEAPVVDKSPKEKRVREKTNDALSCRILRGNPKPTISWSFKPVGTTSFSVMTETTETVQLKKVRQDQTGTYQCTAHNALGSDSFTMELIVEYPPTIKVHEKAKEIKNGEKVRIPCDVTGEPTPTVQWFFKGILLASSSKIVISSDHSIEFVATPSDIGDYTCEAKNKLDTAKITVSLDVLEVPVIDKTTKEKRVRKKTNSALSCRILRGNPKPSIRWSFKPVGTATFKAMKDTTEIVNLKKVRKDQTGTYECTAENTQGSDSYTIELIVEYPPAIKKDVKLKQIKDDDEVTISCDVTGEPVPTVTWFFNGTRFDSVARSRETSDHSLRFKARIADIGSYRCEATNKLGSAKKTTKLEVYVPVSIETPKNSNIQKMVGKSHILECRADGYPKPNIKWSFKSSDPKIPAKDVTPTGGAASVVLKNLQLNQQGLYTCEAENGIGGSDSITYDVKVYAPPAIVNKYPFKNFEVVSGDVALRIQCNATGSPKPSIVWMKNGLNIAIGSEWYDMEEDGTLIIKNIDRTSEGTYVCRAENILGHVTELYEVTVREYSVPLIPTFTIYVKEGQTVKIDCGIPHSKTDQMRWYKDSLVVASGELTLYSVTRSDDGLYTCRVSNPVKSRSVTTKVVVEFKPEFSTLEPDTVAFFLGADTVILSCEAIGQPKPTTAIWKHNGNKLVFTDMSYPLGMVYGATGMYECEVSNAFGSIRRTFKVTSRDCILDIKEDFPKKKQPLMLSRALTWPVFTVSDGYMIIPHAHFFYMVCPSKFSNPVLPPYNFTAFCEGDNTIKINGNLYNFADIQCNEEVEPQVSKTGIACLPGNTEYVKIGYEIYSEFLGVFDVCLDKDNNVPLFTKHKLSPDHTNRSTEAPWSNIKLPQDFSSLYHCSRQMYDITSTLRRGLSTRESCCFGKRQLVNSHDLAPGIPTSSTFDYLNVIPHWSSCNSKNWEDVEQSVRKLAKSTRRNLVISTGTATPLHGVASTVITLHDSRGGKQAVAPYLWKVVQDPVQSASLAIIQINIPELTAAEATKHVRCPNYCGGDGIDWLKPTNWQTVEDGYTYCCSIIDFENAFGYSGRFSPGMNVLLRDGSL